MHTALGMAVCRGDLRLIPAARNAPFCGSIQKMKHVPPALSAAEPVYDSIGNFSPHSVTSTLARFSILRMVIQAFWDFNIFCTLFCAI